MHADNPTMPNIGEKDEDQSKYVEQLVQEQKHQYMKW
jgi:hypothetical protein